MKIIIVGAGVSGLSSYLLLRKVLPQSHTIQVYEAHSPREGPLTDQSHLSPSLPNKLSDSAAVVGNIISLAPNSVRLLKVIDNKLYEIFKARGYINENYTFKTARGHTLAVAPTSDDREPIEYTISCPRYSFWKWLHEVVGKDKIKNRRITDVDTRGEKPVVKFADGGEEAADLVIGADGARSVVKKALLGKELEGKYATCYEGFAGVGSFLDMEIPESVTKDKSMVFTFGPAGSFGYCSAAPEEQRLLSWWSNWGSPGIPDGNIMGADEIRRQLKERHGTWKDPVIQKIIDDPKTDRIYPVWTTPNLPHWGQRGIVLLGDAAHALRAMSGQGAGQALEDSVTYCLLLANYLRTAERVGFTVKEAVDLSAKGLFEIRSPRVAFIRDRSRRMYFTKKRIDNIAVEYMWYLFILVCTKFSMIGHMIWGIAFKSDVWDPEEQVQQYLKKVGHWNPVINDKNREG